MKHQDTEFKSWVVPLRVTNKSIKTLVDPIVLPFKTEALLVSGVVPPVKVFVENAPINPVVKAFPYHAVPIFGQSVKDELSIEFSITDQEHDRTARGDFQTVYPRY